MSGTAFTGNKEEKYKFWKKISNFKMFPFAPNPVSLLQGGGLEILLLQVQLILL